MHPQIKEKRGTIERVMPDGQTAIVRGMFKKETDPALYVNLKVRLGCRWSGLCVLLATRLVPHQPLVELSRFLLPRLHASCLASC